MLYMFGADCADTPVEIREKLALSESDVKKISDKILAQNDVKGCFLLSTCNRTEVYLSCDENAETDRIFTLLFGGHEKYCRRLSGDDAIRHFFETACGLNSLIKRETQIITQITDAEKAALKNKTLDAELEVMIRHAVSTAKKAAGLITDDVRYSAVRLASERLEKEYGSLADVTCLVIGSGRIGTEAAVLMLKKGADVTMTYRSRPDFTPPKGCKVIPYEERYKHKCDILISATKSGSHILTLEDMKHYPKFIADLAVPRDVSPELQKMLGERYFCIDDLKTETEDFSEVYKIIEKGMNDYFGWRNYRNSLAAIGEIKAVIAKRLSLCEEDAKAVSKTVDMLLGGFKESVTPDAAEKCLDKLIRRSR